jgi:hypothetical protein
MQMYRVILSLTAALGIGLSLNPLLQTPTTAQLSNKIAQNSETPLETLANVDNIRFRALTYQRSQTQRDSEVEAAIRRELSGDVTNVRYLYNSIDLDGDGRDEKIVYLASPSTCGTGGCTMLILKAAGKGYSLLSRHTIVNSPIVVSNTTTKGWRDIILLVAGGGMRPSYHILKFDGSAYPSNPSTAPKLASGTIVTGTALISDQIRPGVGIPLTAQTETLTPQQQASLKSLRIAIAVPSSVPADYTVSKVDVKPCEGKCRFGPDYGIVYRNAKQDKCFAIEATGGGVGGVPGGYEFPVETPLFGRVSLLFGEQTGDFKTPSAQQLSTPQPNLLNDWAFAPGSTSPFYRIVGADIVRQTYYGGKTNQCRNTITPNEAAGILRSLSWLK